MTEKSWLTEGKTNTFVARIKSAFSKDEHGDIRPEVAHIPIVVLCGSLVGLLIGGRHGARIRGARTLMSNQLTIYQSSMEAKREYLANVLLGYGQYGCRWGWRIGLYSGLYSSTLTAMAVGRDKDDAVNYIVAGATTGTLYKMFSGFRGIIKGAVLGAGICTPIGLGMQALGHFIPYEKILKEGREMEKDKKQKRLEAIGSIVERMEKELDESKSI